MNQELRGLHTTSVRIKPWARAVLSALMLVALAVPFVASAGHCQAAGQIETGSDAVHANIPCGAPAGGAAAGGGASSTELPNPLPVSDIPSILGNVLRAGFGILGSIALLMFVYGGFVWLTSGGEAEKIKKGKDTMVWAVLGIAIIFASFAIVTFVIDTLAKQA